MTIMHTTTPSYTALTRTGSIMQGGAIAPASSYRSLIPAKLEKEELADFASDLEDALKNVEKAFEDARSIDGKLDDLLDRLSKRNWVGALKASFSGSTEKELATMVQGLGASLGLTQSVVQVMLKIQTQKNRLLHAFNDALVDKITQIQGDAHTLNNNQKQAALAFLGELQDQINEQIRHQKLVDSHEQWIHEHDEWRHEKEQGDAALVRQAALLEVETTTLRRHIQVLEPRLAMLEEADRRSRSLRGILSRNLFPLIALASAIAALSMILRP